MSAPDAQRYGTIVVVGGGCYGSYYLRQLRRARAARAIDWGRVLVVDRDPACAVASDVAASSTEGIALVVREWREHFEEYLAGAAAERGEHAADAIVPSPLMPHLMFDWLMSRARARWPHRDVRHVPLARAPDTPWERASPDGTHYASFATWMCPINCIEPARCPHTRGPRDWSMPVAARAYVERERAAGRALVGPLIFHCVHRAYGVGMFDTSAAIAADDAIAAAGADGPADVLIGTMSHCHAAFGRLAIAQRSDSAREGDRRDLTSR